MSATAISYSSASLLDSLPGISSGERADWLPARSTPLNDIDAQDLLRRGVRLAARLAPDDVPELRIEVVGDSDVLQRLLALARESVDEMETPDDDIPMNLDASPPIEHDEGGGDEGDEWLRG